MPFQKGNKLGSHRSHKSNFKPEIFVGSRWMMLGKETKRVLAKDIEQHLKDGWIVGRPKASETTRKKQSESGKKAINNSRWKSGHKTWNTGEKMPEEVCVLMSLGKLSKYGITREQIVAARMNDLSWCSHHLRFEPNASFTILHNGRRATRCNECHNKHTPWYKEKYVQQRGVCAICGEIEPRLDALNVDHKHDCTSAKHTRKESPMIGCECSRGLLCSLCNPRLGYVEAILLRTDRERLVENSWEQKAFDYLTSYQNANSEA